MNELAQEIQRFEQEVNQLTTALNDKMTAETRCSELEELLQKVMDFLVMLDIGDVITQDQVTERDKLFTRVCQLLYPSD